MDWKEDVRMARVCRQQAAFASTGEVHAALIELAEFYEKRGVVPSVVELGEVLPEKLE
jgi:hypothetical protein